MTKRAGAARKALSAWLVDAPVDQHALDVRLVLDEFIEMETELALMKAIQKFPPTRDPPKPTTTGEWRG